MKIAFLSGIPENMISIIKQSPAKNHNKMKASIYLTAICIMALSIFLIWSKFEINNHDLSIAFSENDDTYAFVASYNDSNTGRVQDYINQHIKPNGLFKSTHDYFDVTTTLADNTSFYVKESPGELKIELNKKKNSTASYYRIKNMCTGLGKLLTGK
jgi:hypothetical protein